VLLDRGPRLPANDWTTHGTNLECDLMNGYRIRIAGYRLNKAGELVPDVRRLSVSQRLRHAGSKRARGGG